MGSTLQKAKLEIETRKLKRREGTLKQSKVPALTNQRWGTPRNNRDAGLSPREERGESLETGAKPGATKPKVSYPFTGMVAGLASLNVNLLLAARRVTSLLALVLAASLAPVLGWLFGPAMELLSSG